MHVIKRIAVIPRIRTAKSFLEIFSLNKTTPAIIENKIVPIFSTGKNTALSSLPARTVFSRFESPKATPTPAPENSFFLSFICISPFANKEIKTKSKEKQNKSKVLVIAHECAHSLQSKAMQVINFTLSNIEMILFAIILVARIFFEKSDMLVNAYTITAILSIIVRLYLEMDATINSVKITTKYMLKNKVKTKDVKDLVALYKKELLKTMPLFILMLFGFKIIRLIISMVI